MSYHAIHMYVIIHAMLRCTMQCATIILYNVSNDIPCYTASQHAILNTLEKCHVVSDHAIKQCPKPIAQCSILL